MRRVSVYTRDGEVGSSSYYRILQYVNHFEGIVIKKRIFIPKFMTQLIYNSQKDIFGVIVRIIYHFMIYIASVFYFVIDCIWIPDCIIILRGIVPKTNFFPADKLYECMLKRTKKCVWDFDDDIFVSNEISDKERHLLEKYSTNIVVTHDSLKQLLPKELYNKTILLPTTDGDFKNIDVNQAIRKRKKSYIHNFRIVWLASSAGLNDIRHIAPQLDIAAKILKEKNGKKLILTIVCNRAFNYDFQYLKSDNIIWTRKVAIEEVIKAHIGIMPLLNNKFSLGKGGFKIIQYMAAGVPEIASDVGFNRQVIDDGITGFLINDENNSNLWVDRIVELASNEQMWLKMSENSYLTWKNSFNYEDNLKIWFRLVCMDN